MPKYFIKDLEIEKYLDLADLIADADSPKKEKMANAKLLDQHFTKNQVIYNQLRFF